MVWAKGGHYSAAVTDSSDIYSNDLASCQNRFPNVQSASEKNYCVLDVAKMFQQCSNTCIPSLQQ
ncbi:hypothetical protein BGX29_011956 [Mortierella sp. GBA35]|nr:hypothetical protein BGX23_001973 [Mortierella sp. AD031]KAF9105571.1 hypothetical protein BGX29_011956 [Mortierella sp. GBA35]